jgi:predicted metal-dependent TIM-barrel fold hydrolase
MMANLNQNTPADKEVKLAHLDLDRSRQGNLLVHSPTTNKTNILLDHPKRYHHPKLKIILTYRTM